MFNPYRHGQYSHANNRLQSNNMLDANRVVYQDSRAIPNAGHRQYAITSEVEQLKRQLREKDEEIVALRIQNEKLVNELIDAKESLFKGKFINSKAPFGHASPHPPYGNISMTADSHSQSRAGHYCANINQEHIDMMIAKALQDEYDELNTKQVIDTMPDCHDEFKNRDNSYERHELNAIRYVPATGRISNRREEANDYEELLALQEDIGCVEVGLTSDQINGLPYTIKSNAHIHSLKNCAICMDDYKNGEKIVYLPCKHHFDKHCIAIWLTKHKTCPICRVEIIL